MYAFVQFLLIEFCRDIVVVEEEEEEVDVEEDIKTKDLVRFLGMKDGVTASMASQGMLSDDCTPPVVVNIKTPQFPKPSQPFVAAQATSAFDVQKVINIEK